jgi:hypothetical protein
VKPSPFSHPRWASKVVLIIVGLFVPFLAVLGYLVLALFILAD